MFRQIVSAVAMVVVMTVLTGVLFPLGITAMAQVFFPFQAHGSLLKAGGRVVGSRLIGQNFSRAAYFHSRPSAAGNGYDASNSGGTNLGPTSLKLIRGVHLKRKDGSDDPGNFDGIADLASAYRAENGLDSTALLPADAVARSPSGLDPEISPENAQLQCARVARARGVGAELVRRLVQAHTRGRQLGLLGEPRVNVLELNLELDRGIRSPRVAAPAVRNSKGSL